MISKIREYAWLWILGSIWVTAFVSWYVIPAGSGKPKIEECTKISENRIFCKRGLEKVEVLVYGVGGESADSSDLDNARDCSLISYLNEPKTARLICKSKNKDILVIIKQTQSNEQPRQPN